MAEVAGTTPSAQYIYGTVELSALEPAYVDHGRRRPKPGPLTEALDRFIAEKIRELAHQINARRQEKLDDRVLDEVHEENRKLDDLKNRFLPYSSDEGNGGAGTGQSRGSGGGGGGGGGGTEWGTDPDELLYSVPQGGIDIGKDLSIVLRSMLDVSVRDSAGRPVRAVLEWFTSDRHTANVSPDSTLEAKEKGVCEIWVRVKGTNIESEHIPCPNLER